VARRDPRKAFGENLRKRRLALGLSQEDLAERAGVHRTYVGSVERGERNVSLDNIVRLAGAVRVKPSDLLDGVGP
jgi:transcriptional regulator with XRE-family HTH domain